MPTTRYFTNCLTLDALTKERNRLAKLHHPDLGGSVEVMQEINAQYEQAKRQLATPAAGRVWVRPQEQESLYEQMMRWARGKEQERLERERQACRDQVAQQRERQRQNQKDDYHWVLSAITAAKEQGLLRGSMVFADGRLLTLYVAGNTYPYREWFKEHGFRWDSEKRHWYFYKKPLFDPDEEDDDDDDFYYD